ncbi:MAG TPA: S8 family serine peptidase [Steroidobacter sp.]|uniref:S8 family serine peptidase n=1 Tax=Steroidobacter sp. TaxID=1978227 RepID=UPI002ED9E217
MQRNIRRRAAVGSLSLIATTVLTVVAADASAAQRAAAAGSKRLESRMPAPARSQLNDVTQLLRDSGIANRVQVAVSLNTAAVGDGAGTSKAEVLIEQTAFISRIAQSAPSATVIGSVQLVANTVFLELDASEVKAIESDRAVTRVAPAGNYKRDLSETVPYIGAETMQGLGVTGKGVRVAVIDSGIDYTHASLGGAGTAAAYAAAWGTSPADARNTTTDGLFPTAKVIGGYDFVGESWSGAAGSPPLAPDPDPIAAPDASTFGGHGTHVADIIGGKDGVAPDVKLYAIKACAVPTSTCSGIALMQSMEWAVDPNGDGDTSDRADIINMSLGSNYGQPFDDDLSAAVDRATKLGAFTVASAGNGSDKPFVTGSPAASVTALSVAQTAVPSAVVDLMTIVSPAVTPADRGAIHQSWSPEPTSPITAPVVYTPSNALGCTPFPAGSLTGVIALVNRGTCAFADKIRNIQAGGALVGIIGMVDGTAPFDGAFQAGTPILIPGYMISLADANAIRSGATVRFDPDNVFPLISSVVSTSSRGPMFEDFRIKPEIGAPGASVSAMSGSGNQSDAFGGTSGAAPMVTGSAALLKQLYPNVAPQRLKQLLINNAEVGIEQPGSPSSVIPDSLAPISRIGGGEVRVDRAAKATAGAYGFDLVKTGTRSGGVSFGFVDVAVDAVVQRRVRVFNRADKPATFKVRPTYRFANDVANGAVKIHTAEVVTVPAKGDLTFDVTLAINGSKLRNNLMNAGPDGPNPVPLTLLEYDGYLVFEKVGSTEKFSLPWHVLPRKAANTVLASGANWKAGTGGVGEISLKNRGVGAAQLNTYALLATSPNTPPGGRGENAPRPDLRAVGVTTFPVPVEVCTSGYLWSFAVNMWERETLPVAVDHRIALDTNNDGEDDYWLLNRDVSLNALSDGRQLAWSINLATGDAEAFWFVEHPTNSSTTVLNACLEQFGLTADDVEARQLVGVSVFADDFYFGGPGDAIEGLTIVPFGERYFAAPDGDLPGGASGNVDVHDFGQIPGTTKELGVMIQTDGDRCVSAGNCGAATASTEALLVAPPGGKIAF